ncbi:amino acid ABC transporter permease [Rhizobium bangladeshense]|uniref:Amino acid ABC transporter permease n=1 Tax=Rhizobium bangladeshense TaxID=1138189 RepID=A0ABS7LLG2_9HYPH|nr:amino acid ABC transporter permease [Rhizobium bangladeshense]MBY3592319.1 amino acid ABC transporter permease [Rhizobium bangladeshense]
MNFDIQFALSMLPIVLEAIPMTILVAISACIGASLLGFSLEMLRRSNRYLGWFIRFVIDFIRSTPALVQIYFFYFVLPFYGVTMPALAVGIVGLSIYYSGYLAEVFKAGIEAIPSGQFEAAKAIGLNRLDATIFVIAPQMLRNIAAPMGSYFVGILKSTPYLAVIGVNEMLGASMQVASDTFRYGEPMAIVGIVFLILAVSIAQLVRLLEERLLLSSRR